MKIEINNRWTGAILYSGEHDSIKAAMEAALGMKADLRGASLRSADLCGADLRGADLALANLRSADLCGASLRGASLRSADLRGAYLCAADLRGAYLCAADLCGADLRGASLRSADLCGADLRGANLRSADLRGARHAQLAIAKTRILPAGSLTAWKKVYDCDDGGPCVAELEIPKHAKRSHAFGRKCRASEAVVVSIVKVKDGALTSEPCAKAHSENDPSFTYEAGKTVTPREAFSEDWQNECGSGIHFFITQKEALDY